jgi:hypothetical protein
MEENKVDSATILPELVGDDDVLDTLANLFGVSKEAVEEKSRRHEIVIIRQMIMYLLREYGGMSFPSIGRLIGNRDHTTVVYTYQKLSQEVAKDPSILDGLTGPIAVAKGIKIRKEQLEEELRGMNATLYAEAMATLQSARLAKRAPKVRVILERDTKILEMYREGLTLQNISAVVGITRERVRQVVLNTIRTIAVNESIEKGIVMDIDVLVEEETKKRKTAQDSLKPVKVEKSKGPKRWSRYYDVCKECGSSAFPHKRKGICQRCLGAFSGPIREKIIADHGNKCDVCGITRPEAIGTQGRDLYIMKDQTVLCRTHFLASSGQRMGGYKKHAWSRSHAACRGCGTTDVPNARAGYCMNCNPVLTSEQREHLIVDKGSKCTKCGKTRAEALKEYGTDFRVTKTKDTLCMSCFSKYALGKKA